MSDIILYFLGIGGGIFSSFMAWWLVYHGFKSEINFSESISKIESEDTKSGYIYRVKFENAGRELIDIDIFAKLSIRGLNPKREKNLEVTYLSVSFDGKIPLLPPTKISKRRPIVRIDPNKIKEFKRDTYPDIITQKVEEEKLLLEDLLNIGTDSWLEIICMAYDKFSGARKVFISKKYLLVDIKEKHFQKNNIEIIK